MKVHVSRFPLHCRTKTWSCCEERKEMNLPTLSYWTHASNPSTFHGQCIMIEEGDTYDACMCIWIWLNVSFLKRDQMRVCLDMLYWGLLDFSINFQLIHDLFGNCLSLILVITLLSIQVWTCIAALDMLIRVASISCLTIASSKS